MLSSNSSQQTEKTNHPQKDLPAQTTDTNQSSASDSLSGELGSDSSQQRGAKLPTNTKISSNPAKDSTAPTTDTNQSETNISPSLADEPSSNSTQLGQSNTNNTSTPQKDLPAQSTELNKSAPSTSQSNNLSSSLTRVPQEEDEPTPDQPDETTPDQQDETTPDQQDEPTPDQPDKANDGWPAREAALNSRKRTSQVSGGPSVPRKRPKPAKPSESEDVSVNQSNFDFLGEPINLTLLLKPEYLWREAAHINILHSIRQKKGDAPTYMMPMLQEIMPSIFHTQVHRATSLQCLQPSQTTNPKTREVLATSTELWSEYVSDIHKPGFFSIVNSCPRLFQLPWPHPFFNRKHVQMDVLIHGIDELLGKDRAGGWTALQSMMCRSSEKGHQNIFDFKQPLKEATLRIHQLVMDSTSYLQPDDGDLPQASHEDTRQEIECKGLGRVGVWLSDQVDKYEPKNKPDQHHKAHRDGMDFLMKRCWEMLHGGSIMHESYDTFTRKRHGHKAPRKVEQRASPSKNGEDASASKNAKHDLHAKRLKSCSSLVLFLNFGVAGWFHCHMNRQRFNFQDLTSLMMLAQEMSLNGLSIRSPLIKTNGSTRKTTHEAIHRPWEQLNDYLIQLLIEIGLGNPRIDWWASVPICKARLQPDVLAPLVIKDFFSEILKPGDTLSSTGGPAPTPKYDESYLQTWQSRVKRLFLTPQKYARLQRDRFSNMGVTSPRRGEDEEDPETDDSDEDETDELDGKSLSGDDDEEGSEEDGEDEDAPGEEDEDAPGEEDEG
ncbi:Golgi to ER traffic- protein [Puccinia graminis f. sp. tritici]|uniref:Golgi to ER traffic-protein n=1 Tax=Puccinia graminis f. sp. tritici TaxID=56615 RepID=A0A5B0QD96_PUCGR|nr:Golgi to ER traffic- protein [Puccinia graminis f. sp. tritici]